MKKESLTEFINKNPIEENSSLLSFDFGEGKYRLGIILEEESLLLSSPRYQWAYISPDKKKYATSCYSGGVTGVGLSKSSLYSFKEHKYRKFKFIKFYKTLLKS